MSSILYLMRKSFKNTLLEMIRHPGKLILYIVAVGLMSMSIIMSVIDPQKSTSYSDIRLLHGAYLGILMLISLPSLFSGMNSGSTFFKMCDVNLLFVSPVSPKKILGYGLVKQMGTTLLISVFLLAYGGMAINMFGITPAQAILLLVGFAVLIFYIQILTMLIYSYANGNTQRIRTVKGIIIAFVAIMVGAIAVQMFQQGPSWESFLAAVSSPVLEYLPVVGWLKGAVFAFISGDGLALIIYLALTVVSAAVCLIFFMRSDADYYEDVLQSTESTFALTQAMKDGRTVDKTMLRNKPVKIGGTGIGRGEGASTFFYKHLREMRRRSRLLFFSGSTIGTLLGALLMVFIVPSFADEGEVVTSGPVLAAALAMGVYIQFFGSTVGEWSRELAKPYIYLVPESPFKKILWASLTTALKPVLDGIVIYTIAGIIAHGKPLTVLLCVLVYGSFGFVFTSATLLGDRLLGGISKKSLLVILYMFFLLVLVAPGAAMGVGLSLLFPALPLSFMGLPIIVWNIGVSIGIFGICRNALNRMEMS